MLKCSCGNPATLVGDVYRDGRQRPERLLLCSASCSTVEHPGIVVNVVLEPEDFRVLEPAAPCWCLMREHGCIVPYCPQHGGHP